MKPRLPPFLRPSAVWLLLAVLAAEFWLFDQVGARRHTAVYPRFNDQIQYLAESYAGHEFARRHGLVAGLLNALTNPSAQGTLHDVLAVAAFQFAGPSRSAALALNLLALAGWQLALFLTVARLAGSRPLAFAAAMLPLALAGPWRDGPGSAYDFRLDHLAMCALGLTAVAAIRADGFRSRSGSKWFGIAVGLTLLTRFITGTYFVLIFAGLAAWVLAAPASERRERGINLLRAAGFALALAGPIFWLNYDLVRDYYWIGHYVGPESAIRSQNFGLVRSFEYVFRELGTRHLGVAFGLLAAGGAVILALLRTSARRPVRPDAWVVGLVFLLAPATVLILHVQKSEVVISALAPGVVTLVTALWVSAARRAGARTLTGFAGLTALLTLGVFARAQQTPVFSPAQLAELRQVNTIADRVQARWQAASRQAGGAPRSARVAVDHITDALDAQVLRVVIYERQRVLPRLEMMLPTGIAEPAEEDVMARLARSDFVFLTEDESAGPYPYDRRLAALRPKLRAWCEANLRPAERFTLLGRRMVLYQRRDLPFP